MFRAFMDLEKAYDRIDREALRSVLQIYGIKVKLGAYAEAARGLGVHLRDIGP